MSGYLANNYDPDIIYPHLQMGESTTMINAEFVDMNDTASLYGQTINMKES